MTKDKSSQNRIQLACKELEEALTNFEQDSGEPARLEKQRRLEEIKKQLKRIKIQLADLS